MSGRVKKTDGGDILWNYMGTVFNMGMGFLMLPMLLVYLEQNVLGLWYVMGSLSGIAGLFTFGFTPAFARNIAYCWNGAGKLAKTGKNKDVALNGGPDDYLLKKILITSKYIYLLISVLAVAFLLVFGTLHIKKVAADIMTDRIWMGWTLFLAAIFMNLYYGYYSSYLIGIGYIKKYNQILVVSGIVRLVVMFLLMRAGMGIAGAAAAYLIHGGCLRLLSRRAFFRADRVKESLEKSKGMGISWGEIGECFSIVWYNAWRDGMVSLSVYLATQASTLSCSCFLTLEETAVYSLTLQLVDTVAKIAKSICNAHTAVLQGAYITGDRKLSRETQAFCVFALTTVYTAGVIALEWIGVLAVRWIKPEAALNRYIIGGYAVYQFMLIFRDCYGAYLSCTNRVIYWKSYLLSGFCSVAGYTAAMYFFHWGIWGIIMISMISEGVYNFRKWPGMVNKELGLGFRDIWSLGIKRAKEILHYEGDCKKLRR